MKVMRNIFSISICFVILALAVACDNPLMDISGSGSSSSSVLIRLAGSNGRTVMPAEPVFSRYELSIQKGAEVITADADRVTGEGVTVILSEGTWAITLNAYQNINGKNYLAAKGTYQLSVNSSQTSYTVVMELNPIAIEDAAVDNGIFSFNFTIPFDAGTAVLSLKNNNGNLIEEINLLSTGSGSIELAPGYYDMSVILTRDDQYAGMFESVHIYSGLESPAVFDISDITFAEKIYLAGSLGGIRIGTLKVTFDEAGTDILKMTELERDTVKRGDFWFIDIPAVNIGRKVYVILEFNGQAVKKEIPFLDAKGSAEIDLNLYPASAKYINLADWYSTLITSESDITTDFGFDITANFFRLTFNDGSNYVKYLPQAVTATKFKASDFTAVSLPIIEFEIFNAADRGGLINAIEEAQTISNTFRWFTTAEYTGLNDAIVTAQNVYPDPLLTDDQINSVTAALNTINGLFNSGRDAVWLSSGYSYSTITANWKEANTADVYRLIYKYANEWDWTDVKWDNADTFNRDGDNYSWTFRPRGYNEIANSGKVLQVAVLAVHTFDDGNIEYLTSNIAEKRLVGPSELNINATMASFADSINVSWNAVDGANGYYVSRRQFGANNNTPTGAEKMYFVTSNSVVTVSADTVNTSVSTSNTESRFTLHDAYLTDDVEEESFSYHYHYLVIPVINAGDFIEYDNYSYTLQENGEAITYVNAVSLEQKGFAIGFARNVTATKGTYASSGNINDGILITWDKPLHLGDAGLQYMIYRRAYNSNTWEVFGPTGALFHVDRPAAGIPYEYAIGINYHASNGDIYGPSQPHASPRFMQSEMKRTDSKGRLYIQGFIQDFVKVQGVSRHAIQVGNHFAEDVTVNIPSGYNWGFDGYTVYLMNKEYNSGNWTELFDTAASNSGDTQVIRVVNNDDNILKIQRDYRHYFKVRSYIMNGGTKIYCPDPYYTWSNGAENEYVKWGARQISADEFAVITSLSMGTAMYHRGTYGVSLKESNIGYDREIVFNNSRPHVVTVNGSLWGHCGATKKTPLMYGAVCGSGLGGALSSSKDKLSTLTITGPSDVNGMYSGTVSILRMNGSSGNGPYKVSYNGVTDRGVDAKHYRNCFTYDAYTEQYKNTDYLNWNPSSGWN